MVVSEVGGVVLMTESELIVEAADAGADMFARLVGVCVEATKYNRLNASLSLLHGQASRRNKT